MELPVVLANGKTLTIEVKKSSRAKHFRLVAGIYGIKAILPAGREAKELHDFIVSKESWILKTWEYYSRLRQKMGCDSEEPASRTKTIYYLGMPYTLQVVKDRQQFATISDNLKVITFHVQDRRKYRQFVKEWYRQQTERIVSDRLVGIGNRLKLQYNRVSIKDQKSRWASCSKKRNLNFNLLLSAAPLQVIDYVIIHELVHLVEFSHSDRFWHAVGQADPDYLEHRNWLKKHEYLIRID
jgi:predicted metal-dependent hydrolase